jgi:hypothetical protein
MILCNLVMAAMDIEDVARQPETLILLLFGSSWIYMVLMYIYRHNYTQYIYILLYIYVCIISIYTLLYPSTMIQKVII